MSTESNADSARAALADLRGTIQDLRPAEAELVADWEKSIKNAELWANWNNHPITKQIYGELVQRVAEISMKLSTDEGMEERVRHDIFRQKKVYKWIMILFRKGSDTATFGNIEKDIRDALVKAASYTGYTL